MQYEIGDYVEVQGEYLPCGSAPPSMRKHSWYEAKVISVDDKTKTYGVRFLKFSNDLTTDNIKAQHVRPIPDYTPKVLMFALDRLPHLYELTWFMLGLS